MRASSDTDDTEVGPGHARRAGRGTRPIPIPHLPPPGIGGLRSASANAPSRIPGGPATGSERN